MQAASHYLVRAKVVAHRIDERPILVDDRGLRDALPVEVIDDLALHLVDVLARQAERVDPAEHRLVQVVDQLAAALGDLAGERVAERELAAADTVARVVEVRGDALARERVRALQAREAGADDPDVERRFGR